MKDLRFVLVGCGRIANRRYLPLLREIEGARLAGVCDIDPMRAETAGREAGVPAFTDYHEMMQAVDADVVCILTPSGRHPQHTIDLATYGKAILVEKPMALNLDDADRMIEACDRHQVPLFVVKQNRYNLPVRKLRAAVEAGRFGKMVMGTVRLRWCRTQEYYDQDPWRGTWANDGGVFTNQASHHIDLLEWMMGDVESLTAFSATRLVNIETEDTGVAILRFRSGALGVIEATSATRPKDLEGSLSVLGELGTVEIGGFAVNEMKIWNFSNPEPGDGSVLTEFCQNPPDVYGFGHRIYIEEAISALRAGRKGLVDGIAGRKSLELISAIYESIETGKEVSLRFRPRMCRLGMPQVENIGNTPQVRSNGKRLLVSEVKV